MACAFRGAGCTEAVHPAAENAASGSQPTPWRRRPTMISTSPLDTARKATSSCPGSPLAPVSGIGTGTDVVVGATVGSAAEVVDSSPAPQPSSSGPARVPPRSPIPRRLRSRRRRACRGCRPSRRFLARLRSRRRDLRTCRGLWQRDGERRFRRAHPRPTSRKFHRRWRSLRAGSTAPRPAKPAGAASDPSHAYPSRTVAVTTTSVSAAGSYGPGGSTE